MTTRKTKLKGILKAYLEMKGKHHTKYQDLFAEIMTETKGNIVGELDKAGMKDIRELQQFTFPSQLPKIKKKMREPSPDKYYQLNWN